MGRAKATTARTDTAVTCACSVVHSVRSSKKCQAFPWYQPQQVAKETSDEVIQAPNDFALAVSSDLTKRLRATRILA